MERQLSDRFVGVLLSVDQKITMADLCTFPLSKLKLRFLELSSSCLPKPT